MSTDSNKKVCTVIGGCGFLGRHMVERLLSHDYIVKVFDIKVTFENKKVTFYTGDLCRKEDILPSLRGSHVVFHHASPPVASGNKSLFYEVNVNGTNTLIEACKEAGVKKLVLTSSASVVYNGSDIRNGTEDLPYAVPPMDYYTETKILQEKLVLSSNNTDISKGPILLTVAIRPHGIFGPRDVQNIPVIMDAAKTGKMKYMIGNGENIVDFTYVDNVTHGHLLAAESLHIDSKVCGQAYHITNDEPVKFGDYITGVVTGLGYPRPSVHLPYTLMLLVAVMIDWFAWIVKPFIIMRPLFTPLRVKLAGTHHYYSCQKAKNDLNYKPLVTYQEGLERSLNYFRNN